MAHVDFPGIRFPDLCTQQFRHLGQFRLRSRKSHPISNEDHGRMSLREDSGDSFDFKATETADNRSEGKVALASGCKLDDIGLVECDEYIKSSSDVDLSLTADLGDVGTITVQLMYIL